MHSNSHSSMFSPHNYSFFKQHAVVCRLAESLYDLESVSEERILQLLGELQAVKKQCHPSIQVVVNTICEELQERLAWALHVAYPLTHADRDTILDACNELRFELIAAELALGAGFGRRSSSDDLLGPQVFGRGGVSHALSGSWRIILFPRIHAEMQWAAVFDDLIMLYEHKLQQEDWFFDAALLGEFPVKLLANLIAYAGRLRGDGNGCFLGWLPEAALSSSQLERAKTCFDLTLVDGFYFSLRGTGGNPVCTLAGPAGISDNFST